MAFRRRPSGTPDLFARERPPRLVLRFAVVLSLTLALASAAILVVVRSFTVSQAEQAAARHASLVAATLLRHEVVPADFAGPVGPARRRELDTLFRTNLVPNDIQDVLLVRNDGLVTYATDHRLIGTQESASLATEAAAGTIVSTTGVGRGASEGTKVLETYAPVGDRAGGLGAASIVQSYEQIERDAHRALIWVGSVLEVLLLVLFAIFVPLLARVTRRIQRQIEQIHSQGFYDQLTGLPNRAHLHERLEAAIARAGTDGRRLGVLLLDVDRFREINDTLGHDAGDDVLREAAKRLGKLVDQASFLARPAGDEFAVVFEYSSESEVDMLAERLRATLERPLDAGDIQVAVEGSVGVALYPRDGGDAETLLRHAEVAMYTAKEWRVGVVSYSPAVDPHDPQQLSLVAELKGAAERGELVPHFQPKMELASGRVAGFEVLTYWQHPTRGLLPPGAFVPVAERTGAIRHLSRAVFSAAVRQRAEWSCYGADLVIAVNLTAVDFIDLDLPDQLGGIVAEHEVDPATICLEITESSIMADPERTHSVLDRLAAVGFWLSVDDFGTGHSSLAYLKNLPVNEVKIDRSFISGMATSPQDRMIVRATIDLAHSLGLSVVAEGVETREVQALLRGFGCDVAQGFLYARPLPAPEVEASLAAWGRVAA
jgi:diguanylate cyclase (GGDEF)-like protein